MTESERDLLRLIAKAATAERQGKVAAEYREAIEVTGLMDEELNRVIARTTPQQREKLLAAWREFRAFARAADLPAEPPISGPTAAYWIFHAFLGDRDPEQAAIRADAIRLMNDVDNHLEAAVAFCRKFSGDDGGGKVIPLTRAPVEPSERRLAAHGDV